MEWLAAKDWNEGQSAPECFEYVQREREEKKDWDGKQQRETKRTSRQRTKGSSKEAEKRMEMEGIFLNARWERQDYSQYSQTRQED